MTFKLEISSNLAQTLAGLQADIGGMGDLGSVLSGLISQASALQSAGVGLPALNSLGSMISTTAAQIATAQAGTSAAPFANTIAALGTQMATGNMAGMSALISSMQSQLSSLLSALDPTGQLAQILHLVQLDKGSGILSSAFQGQHKTTWDQNGVTHSSSSAVTSTAPTLPHNGKTLVSDSLNVTLGIFGQAFNMISDRRLKSRIKALPSVLAKVLALKVKTFNVKSVDWETGKTVGKPKPSFGLIAQEAQKLFPEIVKQEGKFLTIESDKVAMLVLAAFQEYARQTDHEMAAMRKQIAGLKRR